jgi:TadE-like protein
MRRTKKTTRLTTRRGVAAVEFAFVMPFFFVLFFGIIEVGRSIEVSYLILTAAREGARFGCMDKEGMIPDNTTVAEKIEDDVRAFLTASGIPGNDATIDVTTVPDQPGGATSTFDFEDSDNDMEMFQISVSVPFSSVTYCPPPLQKFLTGQSIERVVIFRNSRSGMAQ